MSSQIQLIANSFKHYLGREIVPELSFLIEAETNLENVFTATSSVIVSHGIESDPVFNYGNPAALSLFELSWVEFTALPSRYSAETMERAERERLLEKVNRQGYVDDYRGVRVSSTGKRFLIDQAYVWNLWDNQGHYAGQAAMFSKWKLIG